MNPSDLSPQWLPIFAVSGALMCLACNLPALTTTARRLASTVRIWSRVSWLARQWRAIDAERREIEACAPVATDAAAVSVSARWVWERGRYQQECVDRAK